MAKFSIRRYDVQATLAVVIAVAAMLCLAVFYGLLIRNFKMTDRIIAYAAGSWWLPAVLLAGGSAGLLSVVGLVLGVNSAGQRRNEKQRLSWIGFFLGAAGCSLTIIGVAAFYFLREAIRTGG